MESSTGRAIRTVTHPCGVAGRWSMVDELVVKNGIVIDGTGLARRRADVHVIDGKIVGVGFVEFSSRARVVDADGLIVAPGIVDAHTHYDPQLTFDAWA